MMDVSQLPAEKYSCNSSSAADEPLFGSGTQAKTWLLLEFDTPWQEKAIEQADLPASIKQRLIAFQEERDGGRVQFIRGQGDIQKEPRLFLARADQSDRPLQRLHLSDYQDLLRLDFDALLNQPVPETQQVEPILIVCTNGMRDVCCARNGTDAFQALAELAPDRVFQTTHLGGHRFAANGLWLPYSINYGRLHQSQASDLLDLMTAGKISLPNYRGRTTMSSPAQAADHFLRQQGNWLGLQDVEFRSLEGESPKWRATFYIQPLDQNKTVAIEFEPEAFQVYKTTGDAEPAVTGRFHCRLIEP